MRKKLHALVPGWSIIAFTALLLLSAALFVAPYTGIFASQAQQTAGPMGVDSLSDAEADEAISALRSVQGAQAAAVRASSLVNASGVVISAPAEEIVLVERHAEQKAVMAAGAWERRADVYNYRYADDTLHHASYNYATDTLTTIETVQGVQFPLSQAERDLAVELAFADPTLRAHMQNEYRAITGNEMTSPDQVEVRVFVYRAGATPETESPKSAQCGIQRCAQLLIVTPDYTTFHALPIVNLSTLEVASINSLALSPANAPQAADGHTDHTHDGLQGDGTQGGGE